MALALARWTRDREQIARQIRNLGETTAHLEKSVGKVGTNAVELAGATRRSDDLVKASHERMDRIAEIVERLDREISHATTAIAELLTRIEIHEALLLDVASDRNLPVPESLIAEQQADVPRGTKGD